MVLSVKRASSPIPVRAGSVEFFKINSSDRNWRDLYHRLLSFSWPRFAALVLGGYLAINLLFAGMFWLAAAPTPQARDLVVAQIESNAANEARAIVASTAYPPLLGGNASRDAYCAAHHNYP